MTPATSPPPIAPPADPVRAALDDPATRERLMIHARAVLRGRVADADDVVQEVCRRALARCHTFDPADGTVNGWLSGIAANVLRETYRSAGRRPAQQPDDPAAWERAAVAREDDTGADDARVLAEKYVNQLPGEFREAVTLRYRDELDYREIAAQLGVTAVCVRKRVSRGLELLRGLAGVAPGEGRP
jgi:RNA polymerase sigma-70 factor (ECF subfamily)